MTVLPEALLADLQEAPECAKVRACLQLKGVPFRRTPATVALMRRLRRGVPDAAPPVLELDGETLVGAWAIVDRLETRAPTPPLLPVERSARGYCRLFEQWADRVLGALVDETLWRDPVAGAATARVLAVELVPGPLATPAAWWVRRRAERRRACPAHELAPRLAAAVEMVEDALVDRPYLLGDALTVADVAVYVQLARLDGLGDRVRVPLGAATVSWRSRLDAVEALRTAIGP